MKMKHINLLIVTTALFILTKLCFSTALCENNVFWNCPECGRSGNTGNYCGNCGHPAPWIETEPSPTGQSEVSGSSKELGLEYRIKEDGTAEITRYTGNAEDLEIPH